MASFVAAGVLSTVAGIAIGKKKIKDKQKHACKIYSTVTDASNMSYDHSRMFRNRMSSQVVAPMPMPFKIPPPPRVRRRRLQSENSMIQSVLRQEGLGSKTSIVKNESDQCSQTPFHMSYPYQPSCDLCDCEDCLQGVQGWCLREDCGKCCCKKCILRACECACLAHGQSIS